MTKIAVCMTSAVCTYGILGLYLQSHIYMSHRAACPAFFRKKTLRE